MLLGVKAFVKHQGIFCLRSVAALSRAAVLFAKADKSPTLP
jgi:hypothetical protein